MKITLTFLILLTIGFSAFAQEAKDCGPPTQTRKIASAASPKSIDTKGREIVVYCGSASATQSNGELKPESSAKSGRDEVLPVEKLLEAIAKILSSIAWPIAAVFIAYYFKKELAALIARIKRLKAGSAEAEFAEQIRETEEEVEIERTSEAQSIPPEAIESAAANPRGTILSSWLEVEGAIHRLHEVGELNRPTLRQTRGILPLMRDIQRAELLDSNYVGLFHDLRSLRNDAAHDLEFNPPPEAVVRYVQLARELTSALRKAAQKANE